MSEQFVVVVLFVAAIISALIAAFREDILPKVKKLALAVAFAATAFLVQATDFLQK
jgi:uncharacterized membrane protein